MNTVNRHTVVRRSVLSAALTVGLVGCTAVGPDYTRPNTTLNAFHNQPKETAPPPALDRWWTGFNDPVLEKVVQRALDQNLDLAGAVARVIQARAAAAGAGAELLPTLDVDASGTWEKQSLNSAFGSVASTVPGFTRSVHEFTVGPAASWELDFFGGLRRAKEAARAEAQAVEADGALTRISVAADAGDAYFQVRGYQARLAVTEDQIKTDEHLLRLVHARYDAGSATGREIAQAEALLKHARASIPPLRLSLEQQLNRLDVLMGAQPGTYASELSEPRELGAIPSVADTDEPTDMLRRRPDVIAAERRLAASNERVGAAISDYYPKISLTAALGYDSLSAAHLTRQPSLQSVGALGLRWRLFDFGKVKAEVKQARGAHAEALAAYGQSVLHAAEDVENAWMLLAQTQIGVSEIQDEVKALIKARDLSEQSYRAGSIALTDVLDADSRLLTARDQLDANRAGAAREAVAVYRAMGGGWNASQDAARLSSLPLPDPSGRSGGASP
jgi:NodT family efflux transporter outer membrane factor (OMF) lipoprotein